MAGNGQTIIDLDKKRMTAMAEKVENPVRLGVALVVVLACVAAAFVEVHGRASEQWAPVVARFAGQRRVQFVVGGAPAESRR